MSYHFSKTTTLGFDDAIARATEVLGLHGFGVMTEIDVRETLKKKINADFRRYRILGACNPQFAHRALLAEPKIGLMLPCNVVVQELDNGQVEVSAIDPIASMAAVDNPALVEIAGAVRGMLEQVIAEI